MAQEQPRTLPGPPIAWLLLGIALLLRFYHLGHQSIWVDEYTSFLCAIPYDHMTFHDLWENLHGPLHALALHGVMRWIGVNTVTLRLPTALAGAAAVGVMYRVGERALGRGGSIAAALTTFSPFLIWYSQEARNYAFVVVFAAAATWAWVEVLQTRRIAWWGAYVVACVAGILSNLSMLFVVAAHFGHWLYLMRRERGAFRAVRPWMLYLLVVLAAVSPWLYQLSRAVDWSILYRHVPGMVRLEREVPLSLLAVPYTFFTFCLGFSMGPSPRDLHGSQTLPLFYRELWWMIPAAAFFAFLTLRGLIALRRRPNAFALIVCWLVIPLVLTLYVTMREIKVFNPRYLAVSLPAFYLVWTEAFLSFRRREVAIAVAAVLAGLWGVSLCNHYFNPTYDKDHVREAGAHVTRNWREHDYLLTAGAAMPIHFYVSRYYPTGHFWLGYANDTLNLRRHFESQFPDSIERVWVVSCRPHWYDPKDSFRRFLETSYPVLDHAEMLGCSVYLIASPGSKVGPSASR